MPDDSERYYDYYVYSNRKKLDIKIENDTIKYYKQYNKKIGIYFHLYNIDLFNEFCIYINNILYVFPDTDIIINMIKSPKNIQFNQKKLKKYSNYTNLFNYHIFSRF